MIKRLFLVLTHLLWLTIDEIACDRLQNLALQHDIFGLRYCFGLRHNNSILKLGDKMQEGQLRQQEIFTMSAW